MNYNFYVTDPSEVDFNRICREAPDDANAIVVLPRGRSRRAGLLIRSTFLNKFCLSDNVMLCDNTLGPFWGWSYIRSFPDSGEVVFRLCDSPLDGWKAVLIPKKSIPNVRTALASATARLSKRREVRVLYL